MDAGRAAGRTVSQVCQPSFLVSAFAWFSKSLGLKNRIMNLHHLIYFFITVLKRPLFGLFDIGPVTINQK